MGKRGKNRARNPPQQQRQQQQQQQQQQQSSQQQQRSSQQRRSRHTDGDEDGASQRQQQQDGGAGCGDPPQSEPIKFPTTPPDMTRPPFPPWPHFQLTLLNGGFLLIVLAVIFEVAALLLWLAGARAAAPPPLRATWRWFLNPRASWMGVFGTVAAAVALSFGDAMYGSIATLAVAPLTFHMAGGGPAGLLFAAVGALLEGLVVTETEYSSRLFATCEIAALAGFALVPRGGWLRWLASGCLVAAGAWLCAADGDRAFKSPLSGFWRMGDAIPHNSKGGRGADDGEGPRRQAAASPAARAARRAAAAQAFELQFRCGFRPQSLPRGVVNEAVRQVLLARDYYSVLGAPRGAELDVLRRARNQMSLRVHSDRAGGEGHEAMQRVNEAWHALRDHRAAYDRALSEVEAAEEEPHSAYQWDDDSPDLTGVTQMLYRGRPYDTPYFFNVQYRWCNNCYDWHRLHPGDEWVWESGTLHKYRKVLQAFRAEDMFSGGPDLWQGRLVVLDCTRIFAAMQEDASFPSLIFRLPAFAHRATRGWLFEAAGRLLEEEMLRRADETFDRRLRARARSRYR